MAFSTLLPYQMVSYVDAASGGFTLKAGQTNPGTNQCMTKDMAFAMYNLVANAGSNATPGNMLMQKEYWAAAVPTDTTPPPTPTGLIAYSRSSYVELHWNPVLDEGSDVWYEIFRDGYLYADTIDSSYDDYTYSFNNYTYKVRAVDMAGNYSGFSNTVIKRAG